MCEMLGGLYIVTIVQLWGGQSGCCWVWSLTPPPSAIVTKSIIVVLQDALHISIQRKKKKIPQTLCASNRVFIVLHCCV